MCTNIQICSISKDFLYRNSLVKISMLSLRAQNISIVISLQYLYNLYVGFDYFYAITFCDKED